MSEFFFEPWIGDRYREQSPRLLILGESHYGTDAGKADATVKNTSLFVQGDMNHRFWTNTMRVVLGPDSSSSRGEFWNSVALYNYVQESVGDEAGDRPTPQQFQQAEGAFFKVLDMLEPQAILVLSKALWLNMPGDGERSHPGPVLDVQGEDRASWVYTHKGGAALATWMRHPSRFFAWHSHDVAQSLLAAALGESASG